MFTGLISFVMLAIGWQKGDTGLLIASGLFAIASNIGWLDFHIRKGCERIFGIKK